MPLILKSQIAGFNHSSDSTVQVKVKWRTIKPFPIPYRIQTTETGAKIVRIDLVRDKTGVHNRMMNHVEIADIFSVYSL